MVLFVLPNVADFIECAYGVRFVEQNNYSKGKDPWSIRQTTIYHQYDATGETWTFISPSKRTELSVDAYLATAPEVESRNPFELHVTLIKSALSNWRWYIKSLMERTDLHSARVIAASVGRSKFSTLIDFDINFEDRQLLKVLED
ncbi:MAG: hypothetical protein ACRYGR_00595, partial [Janthinobacterium lividum]